MTSASLSLHAFIIPSNVYKGVYPAAPNSTLYYNDSINMPRNDKEAAAICIIVTIVMGLAISITLAITLTGPFTKHTSSQAAVMAMVDNVAPLVFEFTCYLFIGDIFKTSLLLASIYGFSTTISAIVWSNWVGRLADSTSRLLFVRMTMLVQKSAIVASCILFYIILEFNYRPYLLYSFIVVFGCMLKLAFIANNIAIEKDWIMVMTDGDTEIMLTVMKRIDLFCKTMAPVMMGSLMAFGPSVGAIIIAVWNIISVIIEYQLVFQTYKAFPRLASKNKAYIQNGIGEQAPLLNNSPEELSGPSNTETGVDQQRSVSFTEYIHHKIFPASLAAGMLYLTVLSFGGIMTSYLKIVGYSDWTLGLLRAVAGVAGIASTYILPYLSAKIGIIRAGVWALWFESAALIPVVLSFTAWGNQSPWGPIMLFGGMSVSRIGLWVFDISETMLMQQMVDNAHIGSISGWQHSLCNVFELSQFVLTAVVPDPNDFIIPATVSLGAVVAASISYTVFVKQERGHLFHIKKRL
ncbi:solute carrier family 40 iron-regulated transporter [Mucor ambiguus]|uniref:Solute carrier family 40 member n=1 Tax=Mucor ambiguus TaxID=91626 RepID=A0A0C9MVB7_9FUNG|nr:solute carrier family 40 iron-regulated transporter [Mucor ambiguus]